MFVALSSRGDGDHLCVTMAEWHVPGCIGKLKLLQVTHEVDRPQGRLWSRFSETTSHTARIIGEVLTWWHFDATTLLPIRGVHCLVDILSETWRAFFSAGVTMLLQNQSSLVTFDSSSYCLANVTSAHSLLLILIFFASPWLSSPFKPAIREHGHVRGGDHISVHCRLLNFRSLSVAIHRVVGGILYTTVLY